MRKIANLEPQAIAPGYLAAVKTARDVGELRLSHRLLEVYNWIRSKKPGELRRHAQALRLLSELLYDTRQWLDLKEAEIEVGPDFRDELLNEYTPAERYWYTICFPAWFREPDPKSYVWKQKLMADAHQPGDGEAISRICNSFEALQGTVVLRLIADLSMSTDIVCGSVKGNGLCVQHTRSRGSHLLTKLAKWEQALRDHWKIDRGLLISCLPQHGTRAAQVALRWCDDTCPGDYKMEELA